MKKIIFILLTAIIMLSFTASNAQTIKVYPRAAIDYFVGGYNIKHYTPISAAVGMGSDFESIYRYGHFRVRLGADFVVNKLVFYFDQNVYMDKSQNVSFRPFQAEWFVGLKYRINKNVSIKYEHLCMHPIGTDTEISQSRIFGGYNMFSISYGY